MMNDSLSSAEVLEIIDQYRCELKERLSAGKPALEISHQLAAVSAVEARIRLLCRGGMKIIPGGKRKETHDA